MPRLNDTQAILLASAAARPDLAILPAPSTLKAQGLPLERALRSLLRRGLIAPQRHAAEGEAPRGGASGRLSTLGHPQNWVATLEGLAAIGAELGDAAAPADGTAPEPPPAKDASVQRLKRARRKQDPTASREGGAPQAPSAAAEPRDPAPVDPAALERPRTKKALLIALLSTEAGADVASLSAMLGWLPHTTRAALTGLRKAGHWIETSRATQGGGRLHRIVERPLPDKGAA